MVILIGFPGCGKSYYAKKYLSKLGYEIINRDTLKTIPKCLKQCREYLEHDKKVVIDNTNIDVKNRKFFIDLAKEYELKCMGLVFTTSIDVCKHNAKFRHYVSNGEVNSISSVVYNVMKKKYTEPNKKEGFSKIKKIDFVLEYNKNIYPDYYNYYY